MISRIKTWIALAGGAIIAGLALFLRGMSFGKKEVKSDAAINDAKAVEEGREAVARGRASGDDPDKRVRDNDGRWM